MAKSLEELDADVTDLKLQIDILLRLLSASVPGITSAQFKRQLEQARRQARGIDVVERVEADDD